MVLTNEVLAHTGVHTRRNSNPNLPQILSSPEKLFRKKTTKEIGMVDLERSFSLDTKLETFEDLVLDIKFECNLIRSNSKSNLSEIV